MTTSRLDALLGATTDLQEGVYIPRLKTDFIVKALDEDTLEKARAQATTGKDRSVDESLFNRLLIVKAVADPDLNDKALKDRYEASDAADVVKKALLPGEQARVVQALLKLSGFVDDAKLIDEAKN
ncbi:phage tail assembly chaperone [Paenibacillus sp. SEL1]